MRRYEVDKMTRTYTDQRTAWRQAYDRALREKPDTNGWVGKTHLFENYPQGTMPIAYRDFGDGGEQFFESTQVGKNRYKFRWADATNEEDTTDENVTGEREAISVIPVGPYVVRTDGPIGQIVALPEQGVLTLLIQGQTIQIVRGW